MTVQINSKSELSAWTRKLAANPAWKYTTRCGPGGTLILIIVL